MNVYRSNNSTTERIFKVPEVSHVQTDEYFLTFVLKWAETELESMREIKGRIEREKNLPTRRGLETYLSSRVKRYFHIVRQVMFEVLHSELFTTLTPEEKLKVIGWTRETRQP